MIRNNQEVKSNDDKIALLMAFTETAIRLSFAEAAEALSVTRSTLSRRVQKLEDQIGVQLLNRTTRVVQLTEAGEIYLQYAQRILTTLDEAEETVARMGSEPAGLLTLSVPSTYGRRVIAPVLPGFMERYPQIRLDLRFSDHFVDLVGSGFDGAIRIGEMNDSTLTGRRLGSVVRQVVAAPQYLQRWGWPQHPRDLLKHRCLHFRPLNSGARWHLSIAGENHSLPINPWLQTDDAEILLQACSNGEGIAFLADFVTWEELQNGGLLDVFPAADRLETPIHLVYPKTAYLANKTRVFIDYLVAHIPGPFSS